MSNNSTITCPNCKHEFPIESALSQKFEEDIKARYLKRFNEDQKKIEAKEAQLAREAEQLKLQKDTQDQLLADRLRLERGRLQEEAIKKAADEMKLQMESLNKDLTEKAQKLKESQARELELMQKERQIKEREENLKLEMEKQLLERQREIEERAKKWKVSEQSSRSVSWKRNLPTRWNWLKLCAARRSRAVCSCRAK